jgi:hypothetical protein
MTTSRRARAFAASFAALMCAVTALVVAPSRASAETSAPRPTDAEGKPFTPTTDITDYLSLPGDQVVVVPDGTYTAGEVRARREETDGEYGGWLVLVAESKHGVVVDMNEGGLTFAPQTSRVLMVGFKFVNGSIDIQGSRIAFWHTDHTFPPDVWVDQADDPDRPEQGLYRAPRTVYVHDRTSDHVSFLGSDLHDTSTAISLAKNNALELHGVEMWGLDDGGLDPNDVTHSDAIGGVAGESTGLRVEDSWLKGRVVLIDAPGNLEGGGPHKNFRFEDTWVSDSPSAGFIFTSRKPEGERGIFGRRVRVRSWGHNIEGGLDRLDIVDGEHLEPGARSDVIDVKDVDVVTEPPEPGEESPSELWREENPYEAWPSFFGIEEPAARNDDGTPQLIPARDDGGLSPGVAAALGAGGALGVMLVLLWWRGRRKRARAARRAGQSSGTAATNSSADRRLTRSATVPEVDVRRPEERSSRTR